MNDMKKYVDDNFLYSYTNSDSNAVYFNRKYDSMES